MKQNKLVSMLGMLVILVGASVLISSCTTTKVEELRRFTIISSKNVDISRLGELKRSSNKVTETALLQSDAVYFYQKEKIRLL